MKKVLIAIVSGILVVFLGGVVLYHGRILPNVSIGGISVGSTTIPEARRLVSDRVQLLQRDGIRLSLDRPDSILLTDIEATIDIDASVARSYAVGRSANLVQSVVDGVAALTGGRRVMPVVQFSEDLLNGEIDDLILKHAKPKKDIRFIVERREELALAWDTVVGQTIIPEDVRQGVRTALTMLDMTPISIKSIEDRPLADRATAPEALDRARRMVSAPITLKAPEQSFVIEPSQMLSWITSEYHGPLLVAGLDRVVVGQDIATIAESVNVTAQEPKLVLDGNRVKEFIAPQSGVILNQQKAIDDLVAILEHRREEGVVNEEPLVLDVAVSKPVGGDEAMGIRGIRERIGIATTTLTGSPPNRIANIKNGVKFLTGMLIEPGAEFSTISTLGKIDNTTGYLPELVIKENRTVPEYGGGLCQVSTTLFRAVMNVGLPITQRQNHSYRVPYYERDGEGHMIGPGLDATIYSPSPDFRFKNDTGNTILVRGYVHGDKVTFELYGTNDGRTSSIDGPHLLSTVAAGDPINIETDTLPKGQVKQVEKAHAGGSATATYTVTYIDGTINKQVFNSVYRRWPAQFLVGTKEEGVPLTPSNGVESAQPVTPPVR